MFKITTKKLTVISGEEKREKRVEYTEVIDAKVIEQKFKSGEIDSCTIRMVKGQSRRH